MADGAKPDVPTTDRQNEKKKKHRPFYEAVDAHARRRLIILYDAFVLTNIVGEHFQNVGETCAFVSFKKRRQS